MALMDEFKKANTLYEDQRGKGKTGKRQTRTQMRSRKCEHYSSECCEVSREAVNLGLTKTVFPCKGNIPPVCTIQLKLAAGKTIQELYEK